MRIHIVLTAAVICLMAGGASAGLINYYSFNTQGLVDEAGTYAQAAPGQTTTALTYSTAGTNPISYVTGIGRSYNGAPGNYGVVVASGNGYSAQLAFNASDPDIALGQNFTVEMWVHAGPGGGFTSQTGATFLTATDFTITKPGYGDGAKAAKIGATTVAVGTWLENTGPYGTGWHHLALVANSGTGYYYWDGVQTTIASIGTLPANVAMVIGAASMNGTYPNGFSFELDDLAMWNEALSAGTIAAHASTTGTGYGLTVPEPATLSLLAMGGLGIWFRARKRR